MNITVQQASKLMNKSEQFIRIGLQRGLLPFGTAIQNPGGRYSYYICKDKFEEYTGIKIEDEKKENIEPTKSENSL